MKTKRKSTKIISGLAICLCTLCTANCEAQFKKPVVRTITSGNNVFEVHDYADTVEMLDTKRSSYAAIPVQYKLYMGAIVSHLLVIPEEGNFP